MIPELITELREWDSFQKYSDVLTLREIDEEERFKYVTYLNTPISKLLGAIPRVERLRIYSAMFSRKITSGLDCTVRECMIAMNLYGNLPTREQLFNFMEEARRGRYT